jgi:hypothetical protein
MDYFDARSFIPSDLTQPATSDLVPTTEKVRLAPRFGLAYPIEQRAAVHFAYGHFYQYPAIGQIFANADYRVLDDLQAGGVSMGPGQPDVVRKTVQHESVQARPDRRLRRGLTVF